MDFDWIGAAQTPTPYQKAHDELTRPPERQITRPPPPVRASQDYDSEMVLVEPPEKLTPQERKFLCLYVQGVPPVRAHVEIFGGDLNPQHRGMEIRGILAQPEAVEFINRANDRLESLAVASRAEIEMFLTAALRTPICDIDDSHPLCVKMKTRQTEHGEEVEVEKFHPGRAIEILNKMRGYDAPTKVELTQGGVMEVPLAQSLEEWEAAAAGAQKDLMADAIDI